MRFVIIGLSTSLPVPEGNSLHHRIHRQGHGRRADVPITPMAGDDLDKLPGIDCPCSPQPCICEMAVLIDPFLAFGEWLASRLTGIDTVNVGVNLRDFQCQSLAREARCHIPRPEFWFRDWVGTWRARAHQHSGTGGKIAVVGDFGVIGGSAQSS